MVLNVQYDNYRYWNVTGDQDGLKVITKRVVTACRAELEGRGLREDEDDEDAEEDYYAGT